jgi:hypothetical protein
VFYVINSLTCPAEFEVGEHAKVALLSMTEGEDKPLKYPVMFQEADSPETKMFLLDIKKRSRLVKRFCHNLIF